MRSSFITVAWDENRYAADRLMRLARVRHLPVVRGGDLVGVLSHRDLLQTDVSERDLELRSDDLERLRSQPIAPLVQTELVAVDRHCPPERAAELMLRHRIGFLPVVEEGPEGRRIVGIVTEADLLREAYVLAPCVRSG